MAPCWLFETMHQQQQQQQQQVVAAAAAPSIAASSAAAPVIHDNYVQQMLHLKVAPVCQRG